MRHYLESLSFDLDNDQLSAASWMPDYLGVEPATDAKREYLQSVARVLDPGCKADSVPIL